MHQSPLQWGSHKMPRAHNREVHTIHKGADEEEQHLPLNLLFGWMQVRCDRHWHTKCHQVCSNRIDHFYQPLKCVGTDLKHGYEEKSKSFWPAILYDRSDHSLLFQHPQEVLSWAIFARSVFRSCKEKGHWTAVRSRRYSIRRKPRKVWRSNPCLVGCVHV